MWLSAERGRAAGHDRRLPPRPPHLRGLAARARAARSTEVTEDDLVEYLAALRARDLAPASVARTMVPVRALHRFLADEGRAATDPGAHLELPAGAQGAAQGAQRGGGRPAARRAGRRRSRGAARPSDARGALRHRCAGVRSSSASASATSTSTPRCCGPSARGARSGSCPIGVPAVRALVAWLGPEGRPGDGARPSGAAAATPRRVFLNMRGGRLSRQGAWDVLRRYARPGRPRGQAHPARAAALVRHAHARPRRRHPGRAGAARARLDQHDAGVHAGLHRAAVGGVPERPPQGATRAVAWPDA